MSTNVTDHKRKCYECGAVHTYSDNTLPACSCLTCRSPDTRVLVSNLCETCGGFGRVEDDQQCLECRGTGSSRKWWTIGEYFDPQPEDRLGYVYSELEAIQKASDRSQMHHRSVVAVWDMHDEVQWLFINGDRFSPV